jgi:hypothetical protein
MSPSRNGADCWSSATFMEHLVGTSLSPAKPSLRYGDIYTCQPLLPLTRVPDPSPSSLRPRGPDSNPPPSDPGVQVPASSLRSRGPGPAPLPQTKVFRPQLPSSDPGVQVPASSSGNQDSSPAALVLAGRLDHKEHPPAPL